jgi:hypothetical protein
MTDPCCDPVPIDGDDETGALGRFGVEGFAALWRHQHVEAATLTDDPTVIPAMLNAGRLEVDGDGTLVAVHGHAARPTAHRIEHADGVIHTWCALDAIGIQPRSASTPPLSRPAPPAAPSSGSGSTAPPSAPGARWFFGSPTAPASTSSRTSAPTPTSTATTTTSPRPSRPPHPVVPSRWLRWPTSVDRPGPRRARCSADDYPLLRPLQARGGTRRRQSSMGSTDSMGRPASIQSALPAV